MAKRKLKLNDINKNSSVEVSHTIKKIKEHELRYTIILVVFFMILFGIIGYFTLRIDTNSIGPNININSKAYLGFDTSIQGDIIYLDKNNIMTDIEGLKSQEYLVEVKNTTSTSFNYNLFLTPYEEQIKKCGCRDHIIDSKYIKYTIDGKTIKTLGEDLQLEKGLIQERSIKRVKIRIWIDDSINKNSNYHYHGYIKMKM